MRRSIIFGFEIIDEFGGAGINGGRAGHGGIEGSATVKKGLTTDFDCIGRVKTIIAKEHAHIPFLTGLFEQDRRLGIHAAKIYQIGVAGEYRGEQGVKICLFFGTFKTKNFHALFLSSLFEELGNALSVSCFVVDDKNTLDFFPKGEVGAYNTLNIVTANDTVDFHIATGGDLRVGVGGRDIGQTGGVIDFGRRNLDTGIIMSDHCQDCGIGDDTLGVGNAGVGIGLVIERSQFKLESHLGQWSAQLLKSQLCAAFDINTDG